MASNSTSTDTVVPSSTPTQAPTTPTSSSSTPQPQSSSPASSSIANTSPTPVPTTESTTTSSSIIIPSSSEIPVTSSSAPPPPPTISSTPAATPPTTSSTPPDPTTSSALVAPTTQPTTTESLIPTVSTITSTNAEGSTVTIVSTSTQTPIRNTRTSSSTSSSTSSAATAELQGAGNGSSGGGLSSSGTIAVAVVVPIVAVALLILGGLFFWRKRKARKDAEELRRKEVEEYGYNPNNDPTLPAAGGAGSAGHDGSYEMREDGSSGYRGWGTTAVASSGRKASTTISQSAGGIGMAYSEGTSPTHGPVSDTRSDNALMDGRATSPEAEALGAMGPAASANRTGDINRGPSNASSSYSAAARSDGSGDVMAGGGQYHSTQYDTGNPYGGETQYGSPPGRAEMPAQPVIRDVQARRNTRIENPSHFPQQSAGISQNF